MAIGGSGDSITLDRTAFKALASETRVEILKQLDSSQKTVSDLGRDMNMNKATMFQHLEQLVHAGLVKKDSEEDRATTMKTGPNEAPVAGPPKKWVYYRLTAKGRNLLHPERVKIAVMLAMTVVSCLVLLAVYGMMLSNGPGMQGGGPTEKDLHAPEILSWTVDEVGPSAQNVAVRIMVADNATGKFVSGIDPSSIVVRWGVGSSPSANDPDIISWQNLTASVSPSGVSATIPDSGWASYGAKYLYLSLQIKDLKGNSATYIHHKRINVAGAADLSVISTGISFQDPGSAQATIMVTVSNFGSLNASNVTVGLYLTNPDPLGAGVASKGVALAKTSIPSIPSNTTSTVMLRIYSSQLPVGPVYVMVDPDNNITETGKDNNVAGAVVPAAFTKSMRPPAEASKGAPGFELAGALGAIVVVSMLIGRRRDRD